MGSEDSSLDLQERDGILEPTLCSDLSVGEQPRLYLLASLCCREELIIQSKKTSRPPLGAQCVGLVLERRLWKVTVGFTGLCRE